MKALETASTFALPDPRVALAGDWHADTGWAKTTMRALDRIAPDVETVLHLGDFWMNLAKMDQINAAFGIKRTLVTLRNHEPWAELVELFEAHPDRAVRVSKTVWMLPRPFRFTVAGRRVLSFGGAASVDRYWRGPGESHPGEIITDDEVTKAQAGGRSDLLLSHESPAGTPVQSVRRILRTNPMGFPRAALVESAASRVRVSKVSDAVMPSIHLHGHMHAPGAGTKEDGRRVISLGCNGQQSNLAIINLEDLSIEVPSLRELREPDANPGGRP